MKSLVSSVLALALCATSASALTTVNEAGAGTGGFPTGGDYADTSGATTNMLGNIPLGDSTIIGDLRGSAGDFADWVFFTITGGTEMVSASVTTQGVATDLRAQIIDSMGVTVLSQVFASNGTVNLFTTSDTPLAAGTYNFGLFFENPPVTGDVDWNTFSTVQTVSAPPVPLPAGLPLLLAGLGVFGLMRRRTT